MEKKNEQVEDATPHPGTPGARTGSPRQAVDGRRGGAEAIPGLRRARRAARRISGEGGSDGGRVQSGLGRAAGHGRFYPTTPDSTQTFHFHI